MAAVIPERLVGLEAACLHLAPTCQVFVDARKRLRNLKHQEAKVHEQELSGMLQWPVPLR